MAKKSLPLKEISIEQLYMSGDKAVYEIPIYQRNYAWEKDEIRALVQDVLDAYSKQSEVYYIGTLVSYHKGDNVYEIIDGQQRLTTIYLILSALGTTPKNKLTYRARRRSDVTIRDLLNLKDEEHDEGILAGYRYAKEAIDELVDKKKNDFLEYFRYHVHMIHYQVPKNIDLNHYFEVMNSRGEQLEKHEIVKAKLMEKLGEDDKARKLFNLVWEGCSEMWLYIQQAIIGIEKESVFGRTLDCFVLQEFDDITFEKHPDGEEAENREQVALSIIEMTKQKIDNESKKKLDDRKDAFQPIIDFPNFLLIVLKLFLIEKDGFEPGKFILDDKELLNAFDDARMKADDVKKFGYMLLKSKFLLDNFVVHHTNEEERPDSNPWKLQCWSKKKAREDAVEKARPRNIVGDEDNDSPLQNRLVHLLSMFEVSFTARQRKNYLFYCLMYLTNLDLTDHDKIDYNDYADSVEKLADRYFTEVYLDSTKLNTINTPLPGSFDEMILDGKKLSATDLPKKTAEDFCSIYGNGTEVSKGVPLFIFNYLDYKLWKLYDSKARGEKDENSKERKGFFEILGCKDFGLNDFSNFYFSRTRRSLEHFYPQAEATGIEGKLDEKQINSFGNYAMIGSDANSTGSNWFPKEKVGIYLDNPQKIRPISVASIKMQIMLHMCQEKETWGFEEIKAHQQNMVEILINTEKEARTIEHV